MVALVHPRRGDARHARIFTPPQSRAVTRMDNTPLAPPSPPGIEHHQDVAGSARFPSLIFRGTEWTFEHLEPFAFREEINPGQIVDVVVLFSAHCFTHSWKYETRDEVPDAEIYQDGNEERILDEGRYALSKTQLSDLVRHLQTNHIRVLGGVQANYATFTAMNRDGEAVQYAVFFDVKKDTARKKRILLRVQSAYVLDKLTRRQADAGKVRLRVLLRAVYEGRKVGA